MDTARADEIRRAMEAVEQAPRTETGLIIPPHIAAERQRAAAAPEPAKPNRAQRRRQEKAQRRAEKRERRLERRLERMPADAQQALREVEEITPNLTETERLMAEALVREMEQDPERAEAIIAENMERIR